MSPLMVIKLRYYVTEEGDSPFEGWFTSLDSTAKAKITVSLARLEQGNTSSLKGVGEGVVECRIDFSGRVTESISGVTVKRW